LHPKHAQFLRNQSSNTDTASVRPAGEIQRHEQSDIHISEVLRASGERQRNAIANFILDLRGEALVDVDTKWCVNRLFGLAYNSGVCP
jgi:hypothetical protein